MFNTARVEALELDNLLKQRTIHFRQCVKNPAVHMLRRDYEKRDDENWMVKHAVWYSKAIASTTNQL